VAQKSRHSETSGKQKQRGRMMKKHTLIVAYKVKQIEKEDDFDACKLRGMTMEQRIYEEKLKTFFSLFL
jgi:hypothetical protein